MRELIYGTVIAAVLAGVGMYTPEEPQAQRLPDPEPVAAPAIAEVTKPAPPAKEVSVLVAEPAPQQPIADPVSILEGMVDNNSRAIRDLRAEIAKSTCKCGPHLTEADVRRIALEVVKAELTVQAKTGETRKEQVTVKAGNGEFRLNPGERIIAIDGVPVNQLPSSGGFGAMPAGVQTYATPSYQSRTYGSHGMLQRFFQPQYSVCGPGGCN